MMHYKKPDGSVFGFESDGSQDALITPDMVLMSAAEFEAHINPPATTEQIVASVTSDIQKRLDDFARTRNYDDMKSLVSYAGDPDPQFNKEGTYGKSVRSQTWATSRGIFADVTTGKRPMPISIADIEADLPALVWPA